MATFPALAPLSRQYEPGDYSVSTETGFGGGNVRFLHTDRAGGNALELRYEGLTAAEMQLIRDHYRGQQGGALSFALSDEAWAGTDTITPDMGPWPIFWRYASPPEETAARGGGLIDCTVSLEGVA